MNESEQQLYEMINEKSVAIVGNALSLATYDNSDLIDAHDTVIRINRHGVYHDHIPCGTKIDLWCIWDAGHFHNCNVNNVEGMPEDMMRDFFEYRVNILDLKSIHREQHPSSPLLLNNRQCFRNLPPIQKFDQYYASTGYQVIEFVDALFPKNVSIFGFDWKKSPTFTEKNDIKNIVGERRFDKRCKHYFADEEKLIHENILTKPNWCLYT